MADFQSIALREEQLQSQPRYARTPFHVKGRPGLVALTYWLREKIPAFSAFEIADDRRGRPIIKLGKIRVSAGGCYRRWQGQDLIVCTTQALREQAVAVVRFEMRDASVASLINAGMYREAPAHNIAGVTL